jgi:hypothetical protein
MVPKSQCHVGHERELQYNYTLLDIAAAENEKPLDKGKVKSLA